MSDSEEKKLPPSGRKLTKARERGQIATSREVPAAAVTVGVMIFLAVTFHVMFFSEIQTIARIVGDQRAVSNAQFYEMVVSLGFSRSTSLIISPLAISALIALIAAIIDARGPAPSLEPITPKYERINPVAGFKRIFGVRAIITFSTALVKVMTAVFAFFLIGVIFLDALLNAPLCGERCVSALFVRVTIVGATTGAVILLLGLIMDIPASRFLFRRDMRMSHSELKRERREEFGDPAIRKKRNERRDESMREIIGMKHACLVIRGDRTAVAFAYGKGISDVPMVVAKGKGVKALAIVEYAQRANLPVVLDAPITRALFEFSRLGNAIPEQYYNDIASILIEYNIA